MTREEFIEGIERVRQHEGSVGRSGNMHHKYYNGLCHPIRDLINWRARYEFFSLFDNDRAYYWSLNDRGHAQREMALDIFEQNVLCYGTYKEF